jgi:uncharacterized protein YndB with AHSA1/START domain
MTSDLIAERLERGLRFERRLAHPPERVWRALVDPAELARWLAERVEMDAREGGAVLFRWSDTEVARGTIRRFVPPELLEYTWREDDAASVVRFELRPDGAGTLLILTHREIDSLAGLGAGWHAHLDILEGVLDGRSVEWQERWDAIKPAYDAAFASAG